MPSTARLLIALIFLVLAAYTQAYADTDDMIIGKVVAVADGDTITLSARYWQHSVIAIIKVNSYRFRAN